MNIVNVALDRLVPYENNPRKNGPAVDKVAASIREFGFKVPIIIDKDFVIVAGHTRLLAARKIGMKDVPCLIADDLTPEQLKAFRLADNKTAEFADWDTEKLAEELVGLADISFDMTAFGFPPPPDGEVVEDDYTVEPPEEPVVQSGQVWALGAHRLLCGDSTKVEDITALCGGRAVDLVAAGRLTLW